MSCDHDCERPVAFPAVLFNRPGLRKIDYRIGGYAEMRDHMLARLDAHPLLAAFTHRGADDPGIALLEGAAVVGDILTMYQDVYANELFLRTARGRESIAELVRLTGYRLAPGLGGEAAFALLVKGSRPVVVPRGYGVKAQLDASPAPVIFEADAALRAWPHLSSFHLYRPRTTPAIEFGAASFDVVGALPDGLKLGSGDRVLLGVSDGTVAQAGELKHAQIAIVDACTEALGVTRVTIRGGFTALGRWIALPLIVPMQMSGGSGAVPQMHAGQPAGQRPGQMMQMSSLTIPDDELPPLSTRQLVAFKLSAGFRHFGSSGAPVRTVVGANGRTSQEYIDFRRPLDEAMYTDSGTPIRADEFPLDRDTDAVAPGTTVVVEGDLTPWHGHYHRWIVRKVASVAKRSAGWGTAQGSCTWLALDDRFTGTLVDTPLTHADIRSLALHVVEGEGFLLHAPEVNTPATTGADLDFHGTPDEVSVLADRALLLVGADGSVEAAHVASVTPSKDSTRPGFQRIRLDREVKYADFEREAPRVTVHGNVLRATEGKTEDEAVLGDGDHRLSFQTFPLPKSPLTYRLQPGETPPHHAELYVWVGGIAWSRVDTFFAAGPDDHVFIVREDDDGRSWVQFGDGANGARLPSGKGNIVARWRTGSGSTGPVKAGTTPQPGSRLDGLDKVLLPGDVVGGAAPETESVARVAAPGRMQSLGRLVSLADFEAEALAVPGVTKVRATWTDAGGTPCVQLTVLTASESPEDADKVAATLSEIDRTRGPRRHVLRVIPGTRRYVSLHVVAAFDARRREADMRAAILEALGVSGLEADGIAGDDGLFSLAHRGFGQSAHSSQILAAVQHVEGVAWVRLPRARFVLEATTTTTVAARLERRAIAGRSGVFVVRPVPPVDAGDDGASAPLRVFGCTAGSVLALDASHLQLDLVPVDSPEPRP